VLGLLVAAVVVTIATPEARWAHALAPALQGASVVVALGGRRGDWAIRSVVLALVAFSVAGGVMLEGRVVRGSVALLNAAILAALPVIFVVRLRRRLSVSFQTVLAAVSIYLVIGMVFSSLDPALSALTGTSFFKESVSATTSDYTYFSFITLCTVGYGDLVPSGGLGRASAVTEALLGQLYLVTIVALLVGNVGRSRAAG
jgi:ion channel